MYVVILLETESEFPGVQAVFGPYDDSIEANRVADTLAEALGFERGEHVQVAAVGVVGEL